MKPNQIFYLFTLVFFYLLQPTQAQKTPLIQSHNDYLNKKPLLNALKAEAAMIEIDLFKIGDQIYAAHDAKDAENKRNFEDYYLIPLQIENNYLNYKDKIFLIDIKNNTEDILKYLKTQIVKYPQLFHSDLNPNAITLVLSGNVPPRNEWENLPKNILIDGRPSINYSSTEKNHIALVSSGYKDISDWKGKGKPTDEEHQKALNLVNELHKKGFKVRFWGTPDNKTAWKYFHKLGVDYLSTDKPIKAAHFYKSYGYN